MSAKDAQISAIFRKETNQNYRPVSLTSAICKTMEKIIRNYLHKSHGLVRTSVHKSRFPFFGTVMKK